MQDDLVFRIIATALFIGARFVRWHARHQIGWKASWPAMKQHPRDTTVLFALSFLWLSAIVLFLLSPDWLSAFSLPIAEWIRWCAVALAIAGLAFLWWSDHHLGLNLSVTLKIREGHTLVTGGPYRHIRHPVYTATILYSLALAIITANYVLGAMFVAPMVTLVWQRVGREEQMMIGQFGDDYRDYMKRTGRLLPRFRGPARADDP